MRIAYRRENVPVIECGRAGVALLHGVVVARSRRLRADRTAVSARWAWALGGGTRVFGRHLHPEKSPDAKELVHVPVQGQVAWFPVPRLFWPVRTADMVPVAIGTCAGGPLK